MWTEPTMPFGQSVIVSLLGLSVVFLALICLALAIMVISKILRSVVSDGAKAPAAAQKAAPAPAPAPAPAAAPAPAPAAAPAGATTVESPMPGKILNIKVSEGQAVKFGEVVVIMEAMKMETEIVAPADGTVSKILVKAGDSVDTGAALVALN